MMNDNENNKPSEDSKEASVSRALIGGAVGATLGWLYKPETRKLVVSHIRQSEAIKTLAAEIGRSVQERVTEQALKNIKSTTAGFLNKDKSKDSDEKEKARKNEDNESTRYSALEEENKRLANQLQMLEEKLNKLVE